MGPTCRCEFCKYFSLRPVVNIPATLLCHLWIFFFGFGVNKKKITILKFADWAIIYPSQSPNPDIMAYILDDRMWNLKSFINIFL